MMPWMGGPDGQSGRRGASWVNERLHRSASEHHQRRPRLLRPGGCSGHSSRHLLRRWHDGPSRLEEDPDLLRVEKGRHAIGVADAGKSALNNHPVEATEDAADDALMPIDEAAHSPTMRPGDQTVHLDRPSTASSLVPAMPG